MGGIHVLGQMRRTRVYACVHITRSLNRAYGSSISLTLDFPKKLDFFSIERDDIEF